MKSKLIDVEAVAVMLMCGVRTVWRFRDSGRMPPSVSLGRRLVRWRESDISAWIADGCPDCKRRNWTPPAGCGCDGKEQKGEGCRCHV